MGPKCHAVQCGMKNPKTAPSPWDFINPLKDRAMAMQKIGKDHMRGSGDMLADRQTHTPRRAHYNTSSPLMRAM